MALPVDFRFSQNNLQDFTDCPRRFELKYLLQQDWPAMVSQPIQKFEHLQILGSRFHTLVQQNLAGLPIEKLEITLDDPNLIRWWKNYLTFFEKYINSRRLVEYPQIIHFRNYRLIAKYDLLIFEDSGNIIILDWKTTQHRTASSVLRNKMQSLVYPYVLAESYKEAFRPENVQMIFWFPEFPSEPEVCNYSTELHKQNEEFLNKMIGTIAELGTGKFELTDDERKCKYCIYRSLCDRGVQAGDLTSKDKDEVPDSDETDPLNFNEIEEIEF